MAVKTKTPKSLASRMAELGLSPVVGYDPVEFANTGSLLLNWALGGGLPRNRVTNIWGESTFGKTTISLLCAVAATENGEKVAYFDTENAIDARWVNRLGVDPDLMELYQPNSGEQMGEAIEAMLLSKEYGRIFIDCVAETVWNAEHEASMNDYLVGLASRKWGQFFKKISGPLRDSGTCLVMLNQVRNTIGGMGDPDTQPGGKQMKFKPSIIIKMMKPNKDSDDEIVFRPNITKNKHAPAGRKPEITLKTNVYQPYVDPYPEITELGKELGIFTTADGSPILRGAPTWHFNGVPVATGEAAVQKALREDSDLFALALEAVNHSIAGLNKIAPPIIREVEVDE